MTAQMTRRPRAKCPVLTDPGYGRTWEVERIKMGGRLRWLASLNSRTGTLLGYVMEYDNGWGASSIVRGRCRHVGLGGHETAQAAGEQLLETRKP